MQLSDYQVTQICEHAYHHVVGMWRLYDYAESAYDFAGQVIEKFNSITYPQLSYRIVESQGVILNNWKAKINNAAREWYKENVERRREEEAQEEERRRREKRDREEQEEREEEERRIRWQQQKEREEQEEREYDDALHARWLKRYEHVRETLGGDESLDGVQYLVEGAYEEMENARDELERYEEERNTAKIKKWEARVYSAEVRFNVLVKRRDKLEEAQRKAEEEAKRKAEAEEKARLQAEAAAKRKAQEEVNRKKLEEMQAQWKAKHNPTVASQGAKPIVPAEIISCPQCGNQVSRTTKFCTSCGTKLFVTCPECGATLKATTKFCTSCGKPVSDK